MATKQKTDYPRQDYYTGNRMFSVSHPEYGSITVKARDNAGAIVTAVSVFGVKWQKYSFYAYFDVHEIKKNKSRERS